MTKALTVHEGFREWMVSRAPRKDSEHTRRAYRNDIIRVADQLGQQLGRESPAWDHVHVGELTTPALRRAFAGFSETHSSASIARAQSTWRGLCRFCAQEGWIPGDPMAGIIQAKVPRRLPKPLRGEENTAAELLAFLAAGGRRESRDPWPERDYAVIATLLFTGVRSAELRSLTCGDIFGGSGEQRIRVLGKGNKERAIPVETPLMGIINDYIESRKRRFPRWKHTEDAHLFVNSDNEALSPTQLRWLVAQCLREAGLGSAPQPGTLVHAFRSTYATLIAAQGATASEIMQLLGHESLNTSQGYIKAVASEVRASAAANPLYRRLPTD